MTATTTRLALPITLGSDFPYEEAFLNHLSGLRECDSTWHGLFLAAWLTPKETLLKLEGVADDLHAIEASATFDNYREGFYENPAVDFANDDLDAAVNKFLARKMALRAEGSVPSCFAFSVLSSRPGDVTADGREVAK